MFLEQINRRLSTFASEVQMKSGVREAPRPGEFKTIGVRVDSETYVKLLAMMEQDDTIKTVKTAALIAMQRGLL